MESAVSYYFDFLSQKYAPHVRTQWINNEKGRGAFITKDMVKDEVIFIEKPLIAMQHVSNRDTAWTCSNCFSFLGSLDQQIKHHRQLLGMESERTQEEILQNEKIDGFFTTDIVGCFGGCGEFYCSETCRLEAFNKHHRLLCVGPLTDTSHPLIKFKQHAIETNELFLLAAQVVAKIISDWLSNGRNLEQACFPFSVFLKRPWWEVKQPDTDLPVETLKQMLSDSLRLLREAMFAQLSSLFSSLPLNTIHIEQTIGGLLSFEFYALLLGMLELNDNSIEIRSPLQILLESLREMRSDSSAVQSKAWARLMPLVAEIMKHQELEEHMEEENTTEDREHFCYDRDTTNESFIIQENCNDKQQLQMEDVKMQNAVESLLWQALEKSHIFPPFEGFGLYPLESVLNHSCAPNCIVNFRGDHTAIITAIRPILSGEELDHSYIDNDQSFQERQEDLKAYGFTCICEKCKEDSRHPFDI